MVDQNDQEEMDPNRRALLKVLGASATGLGTLTGTAIAAPGDQLGRVQLPDNSDCSIAGTFDGEYYSTIRSCPGTVLQIYAPPKDGDGVATKIAAKPITDGQGNTVEINALEWDPSRGQYWASLNSAAYLIDRGDPTSNGNAVATEQFDFSEVPGGEWFDGIAYDNSNEALWVSRDVSDAIYKYDVNDGSPLNRIAPKNENGNTAGRISGLTIGATMNGRSTIYCGRDGAAEIIRVYADTGEFISKFAQNVGERVEALTCDPVTYNSESLLVKDAYNGYYTAFEVEPGTCPLGGRSTIRCSISQIQDDDFPEIDVFVSVLDDAGNPITGLSEDNFSIAEDGVKQTISSVTTVGGGASDINASLVVDSSGSMSDKIDEAKTGAKTFVEQLDLQGGDQAAVVDCDGDVTVRQGFTSDESALDAAIDSLTAGGQTALFDAVERGIRDVNKTTGRQAVIVLADGENNTDPDRDGMTIDDIIQMANNAGISIYTIGLVTQSYQGDTLRKLANKTDGLFFEAPDSSDLQEIYSEIAEAISGEYHITYTTTNDTADGTTRTVKCTTTANNISCSDKGTYTAPSTAGGCKERVVMDQSFENTPAGEYPSDWIKNGNSSQKVTTQRAATGDKSLQLNGTPGGCWEAIANRQIPFRKISDCRIVFSGAYLPTDNGAVGCHNRRGELKLRTSASGWDAGKRISLFEERGAFVDAAGNEVAPVNEGKWNSFKITYERSGGKVTLSYQFNGQDAGQVMRDVTAFEDDLQYLAVNSGDFTVFWDDLQVSTGQKSSGLAISGKGGAAPQGGKETVSLTLKNTTSSDISAPAVGLDGIPNDWTIAGHQNDGGTFKEKTRTWVWLSLTANSAVNPSITLEIPKDTPKGEYTLTAKAIKDGTVVDSEPVTVNVGQPSLAQQYDNAGDDDDRLDLAELQEAITDWQNDTDLDPTLQELQTLIDKWQSGQLLK